MIVNGMKKGVFRFIPLTNIALTFLVPFPSSILPVFAACRAVFFCGQFSFGCGSPHCAANSSKSCNSNKILCRKGTQGTQSQALMKFLPSSATVRNQATSTSFPGCRFTPTPPGQGKVRGIIVRGMKRSVLRIIPLTNIPLTSLRRFPSSIVPIRPGCGLPRWDLCDLLWLIQFWLRLCRSGVLRQ